MLVIVMGLTEIKKSVSKVYERLLKTKEVDKLEKGQSKWIQHLKKAQSWQLGAKTFRKKNEHRRGILNETI